jgi:hypothetical protein
MNQYVIFHIDGGIGKNIAATSVVKSIKAAFPDRKLIVVTAYPEVFLHNINIYRVYKFGYLPYFYDDYIKDKNSIILRMEPYHSGDLLYKRKSLPEIWCDVLNIKCVDNSPEIFLTQRELIYVNNILKKEGPLSKEDVVDRVMKERYFKKNTILVNLVNPKYFKKNKGGLYIAV